MSISGLARSLSVPLCLGAFLDTHLAFWICKTKWVSQYEWCKSTFLSTCLSHPLLLASHRHTPVRGTDAQMSWTLFCTLGTQTELLQLEAFSLVCPCWSRLCWNTPCQTFWTHQIITAVIKTTPSQPVSSKPESCVLEMRSGWHLQHL